MVIYVNTLLFFVKIKKFDHGFFKGGGPYLGVLGI